MKYKIHYVGAVWVNDSDNENFRETDSLEEALSVLYMLHQVGFKSAYVEIKDSHFIWRFDEDTGLVCERSMKDDADDRDDS